MIVFQSVNSKIIETIPHFYNKAFLLLLLLQKLYMWKSRYICDNVWMLNVVLEINKKSRKKFSESFTET